MLGWSDHELMSQPVISFVHPDDVSRTAELSASMAARQDTSVVSFENRFQHKDGHYIHLLWVRNCLCARSATLDSNVIVEFEFEFEFEFELS